MRDRLVTWMTRAALACAAGFVLVRPAVTVHARAGSILERPCTAYWNAAVVFAGRVDSIQRTGASRRFTVTVLERFRHAPGMRDADARTVTLTLPSSSPCASRLRVNQEYIIYADRDADGLSLARCSRTREIGDAAADVSYARSVLDGTAPAGTIGGRVVVSVRDLAGRIVGPAAPVAGAGVRVAGGARQDQALTNRAGDFTLPTTGAGAFAVTLDVPDRFYGESTTASIELRDARACADVELRIAPDGRLAGQIVDADRRPLPGLTVEMSTPNLTHTRVAVTGGDGRYELTRLPAGRFVVSVAAGSARGGKAARVFLPGTTTLASAARVIVGEGEQVAAPEFRLPAAIKYIVLSGFVLDADGTPAEGAHVYVKGANEGDRILGEPVPADFVGRFTVAAPAGSDYVMFAERKRGTRVDSSDPIRLTTSQIDTPVRLILQRRY